MAPIIKTAALKPISANKPRLQFSSAEKSTAAPTKRHGKENVAARARVPKRKADEQAVAPPRLSKRKDDEKAVVLPRATKRKLDNDEQVVASPPRATKDVRTDGNKALTYPERLAQAGRSWALLEAAAANKDWHKVIKLGGSVSGMSGGGLVLGEKYKVPKSYNYIMRHKKWRY
ncbi:hypothetical protein FPQ18DRAFT_307831 [Pyronema domesticum]|uniref:Uncharacterized protein n=1 Tax=Pyronema omphalodes (strain CBS 100304) TaxID=1076935 RepID=U4LA23_PYROM|nr:hypothetical protein FPQ18DRAFT_307831 [Pyronema domesticum]CCX15722.1 Protein of unknown function [Pyronema omphalodes CBS 100304]